MQIAAARRALDISPSEGRVFLVSFAMIGMSCSWRRPSPLSLVVWKPAAHCSFCSLVNYQAVIARLPERL